MTEMRFGVVEDRADPLLLGRCKVRVVGLHTENTVVLPTSDLPWAIPMTPITSASVSGVGDAPVGPVEGTWVVVMFRDDSYQQPIMIGTLPGIPLSQNTGDLNASIAATYGGNTSLVGLSGYSGTSSSQTSSGTVTSGTSGTSGTAATDDDLSKIPIVPPIGGNTAAMSAGIQAIIAACKAAGFTNRNAVCALLGIVGGESKWIPQNENYSYDRSRLQQIMGGSNPLTAAQLDMYQRAPSQGMSAFTFFSFMYSPTRRKSLGNRNTTDAGNFFGRGFIQLTGYSNYNTYAINGDIVNNPNLLVSDINISARVAVAYAMKTCKTSPSDPAYFQALLKAVGNNSPDIAATKRNYYEYFLGGQQPVSPSTPLPTPDPATLAQTPPPSYGNITPNQNTNTSQLGFNDPTNTYPRIDQLREPDTNRLARNQKILETIYKVKKDNLETNIGVANSGVMWNQLRLPYNAMYPFNHVMQTESGHTTEFDDTPGFERVHIYHKAGTFLEIDNEGNISERVMGSKCEVVEEVSLVYIKGARHTKISEDESLFIGGQLQMQVQGNLTLVVNGAVYQTVTGNVNTATGGSFNVQAAGQINLKAGGEINIMGAYTNIQQGVGSPDATPAYNPTIIQPQAFSVDEIAFIETMECPDDPVTLARRQVLDNDTVYTTAPSVTASNTTPPPNVPQPVNAACDFPGDLTYNTILSPNFKLGDLCFDQGRPFPFGGSNVGLSDKVIACNLKQLCLNILEPMRSTYASYGFKLNSGYRNSTMTNTGSVSQHARGQAADISFTSIRGVGNYDTQCQGFYNMAIQIRDSGLPIDQLLLECNPAKGWVWIHASFNPAGNRARTDRTAVMTYVPSQGYVPGLHLVKGGVIQTTTQAGGPVTQNSPN